MDAFSLIQLPGSPIAACLKMKCGGFNELNLKIKSYDEYTVNWMFAFHGHHILLYFTPCKFNFQSMVLFVDCISGIVDAVSREMGVLMVYYIKCYLGMWGRLVSH